MQELHKNYTLNIRMEVKAELQDSPKENKRFRVVLQFPDNTTQTVDFGDPNYENYTIHKDIDRKINYIKRHRKKEDWDVTGIATPGFWSRWLLWNKPTLYESINNIEENFPIDIIT